MKEAIEKYLGYLRDERNASGHTLRNYRSDLGQFRDYLAVPDRRGRVPEPRLAEADHLVIREYLGHLYSHNRQKTSVARKLASLRSFFKFCVREGWLEENPARLVRTPRLPQRLPSVPTAEQVNRFLDACAEFSPTPAGRKGSAAAAHDERARRLIRRDRALLEFLYASGLRAGELVGLNLRDIDRKEQMLRVRGKGRKERLVPFGSKAAAALDRYREVRDALLPAGKAGEAGEAVFLGQRGERLSTRALGRIVKKYSKLFDPNWDLHPHMLRHAF
ncbi:MAG: tyrosine-type recombinase/integrase, partial [Candidatus Acidiferrales bacterium]